MGNYLERSLADPDRSRFGAVLEEFEVRDALNTILAEKDIVPAMSTAMPRAMFVPQAQGVH